MQQAIALFATQCFEAVPGDASYDAEANHRLCREELGIPCTAININRSRTGERWPPTFNRRARYSAFRR